MSWKRHVFIAVAWLVAGFGIGAIVMERWLCPVRPVASGRTIASGRIAMPISALPAGTCIPTVTAAAQGTQIDDLVQADPGSAAGGIAILVWPTANQINFKLCNESPIPIPASPGPLSVKWRVMRPDQK